jgi:hypothetical protein
VAGNVSTGKVKAKGRRHVPNYIKELTRTTGKSGQSLWDAVDSVMDRVKARGG